MRLGINERNTLEFIRKVNGWHTWDKRCIPTVNAIRSLERKELIETNEFNMFKSKGTA